MSRGTQNRPPAHVVKIILTIFYDEITVAKIEDI